MDPGFLKLLDDDEDDNAPPAADVDAFAAVLKGDLGAAAHVAATSASYVVSRTSNGTGQTVPQSTAATVSPGHIAAKPGPLAPTSTPSGQQQLLWNQLSSEQQRDMYKRRALQQRLQQQQQQHQQQQKGQQQPHQQSQQSQPASGVATRKGQIREGISFTALMPLLQPHLPAEQGQQLSVLYQRFKRNEITREDFIRGARVIAGDHVLVQTIREMHGKQQAQLELQQQKQQQQPSRPQSSEAHSSKPNQMLLLNVSASVSTITAQQQQQQQQREQTNASQQNLQPQTSQPASQTQELNVTGATQQKLPPGHTQAHSLQQTQVPSKAELNILPKGPQPQLNLSASVPQTQLKSSSINQGDRQQDSGQLQPCSNKSGLPMLLQQVKHEVDLSLAKQQSSSPTLSSIQPRPPLAVHQLQVTVATGAGQPLQPFTQMSMLQQSLPSQSSGHVPVQQSHVLQVPGPVASQPQPAQASALQAQLQPEKPLTKYAKQKLRREQKKRDEEERARKLAEEERLKKVEEEDNTKKLHSTNSGTVIAVHQGLHPQLSTARVDLNKQAYVHPGSLSQQAQLQASVSDVDKQQTLPLPSGPVGNGQALPLIPVKQESSDLQSELKRQSFQLNETLDLLPGQAAQKLVEHAQLSETSVPPISHDQVQGSNSERATMVLSSPGTATKLAQQADTASMTATSVLPIPSLAGASDLQSTAPTKQVVGQQMVASVAPTGPAAAGFNATSLHPVASFNSMAPAPPGQTSQTGATVIATAKNLSRKPAFGQKKTAESTPAQPPNKKQKVSIGEPDQSIEQLNDVTAVSGVNLKEEEEQLLIGPKEESRTTEAMRKIVQEEEERLFLEKGPLMAKVAAIAIQCGVKIVSEDVGKCLSMSVEERLRSMLYRLIKLSKQRCDVDKESHKLVRTSDVRRQILLMKRKAKEMLDKKLAEESEQLRKLNEVHIPTCHGIGYGLPTLTVSMLPNFFGLYLEFLQKKDKGSLPEMEREELKAKAQKAQQEEEDRLKANAANVAARAAVGADDMLLKWQMMAAQGRQKRQGGDAGTAEEGSTGRVGSAAEGTCASHCDKKLENGDLALAGPGNNDSDSQGPSLASTSGRPSGPGPGVAPRLLTGRRIFLSKSGRGERAITIKDVIALLETEPQMSKSTLLYQLYERNRKIADGEKGHTGSWR